MYDSGDLSSENEETIKVAYHIDVDEVVYAANKINTRYKLPSLTHIGFVASFLFNSTVLPMFFFINDMALAGFTALAVNVIFSVFLLPQILKTDLKRFILRQFPDIENEMCEIEITDDGFFSRYRGDYSFHQWRHVKEVELTQTALHIYLDSTAVTVPLTAFAYREDAVKFAGIVRRREQRMKLLAT